MLDNAMHYVCELGIGGGEEMCQIDQIVLDERS